MKTIFTFLTVAIVAVLICDRYQDNKFILFAVPVAVIGLAAILHITDNRHYELYYTTVAAQGPIKLSFFRFLKEAYAIEHEVKPTRFRFKHIARFYATAISNSYTIMHVYILKKNNEGEIIDKTAV